LLWRAAGVTIACAWLLLPSTLSTAEFLSTRCYIEGVIFSLVAYLCARRNSAWWWPAAALALLSKELFVASLLTLLGLVFLRAQRWRALACAFALAFLYLAYRAWAVGLHVTYSMPLPSLKELIAGLAWLPHSVTYGFESYLVLSVGIILAVAVWRDQPSQRAPFFAAALLFFVSLATLAPITIALLGNVGAPAPWGRSYFVVHALMLVGLGWLARRQNARAVWLLVLPLLVLGASRSVAAWDARKALNRIEGEFFLSHPGELLVSHNDAFWFFDGLARLSPIHAEVVHATLTPPERIAEARKRYPRWWHVREGRLVSVPR
jgi:hypothetical protein